MNTRLGHTSIGPCGGPGPSSGHGPACPRPARPAPAPRPAPPAAAPHPLPRRPHPPGRPISSPAAPTQRRNPPYRTPTRSLHLPRAAAPGTAAEVTARGRITMARR